MNYYEMEELRVFNSKKFLEKICEKYSIQSESLESLLVDYELIPLGAYGPADEDPYPGSMTEIAQQVGLPVRAVGRLQDLGAICKPITHRCFDFLEDYRKAWGNLSLIRSQIYYYSQRQREDLIRRPELATRWERCAYGVFVTGNINYGLKGQVSSKQGQRIQIADVAAKIEKQYGVSSNAKLKTRLEQIREMARSDRRKAQAEGISEKEMASRRDVVLE